MVMPARSNMHQAMLKQSGKQREQSQHLPRPARVRFSVKTTGVGETRLTGTKSLDFGALMLEEPTMSWGVVALTPLTTGQLPQCTAVVLKYHTNSNGSYVGADVAFKVDSANSKIKLKFNVTFEGSTLRSTLGSTPSTNATGDNAYQGQVVT